MAQISYLQNQRVLANKGIKLLSRFDRMDYKLGYSYEVRKWTGIKIPITLEVDSGSTQVRRPARWPIVLVGFLEA